MFLFGTRLATPSVPPPCLSRPVPNANARRRQLTPYDLIKSQVRASSSWRDPTLQYKSSFVLSTAGTILVAIVDVALHPHHSRLGLFPPRSHAAILSPSLAHVITAESCLCRAVFIVSPYVALSPPPSSPSSSSSSSSSS